MSCLGANHAASYYKSIIGCDKSALALAPPTVMAEPDPAIHVLRWWTDKDMAAGSAPAWR
jgi:hypothetical protein